ncbi:MAG TPA: low temperature requirement protein A [Candidatus Dormibacteraeota bacterium]|nr:low temperature requirement protein A [Candidatus Dormibacteraeota bacterium]
MAAEGRALRRFKTWFWRPPRPHGDTIADRRVSPLELLYDLVYAAVLAQAGNHLATHMSAGGFVEFAAVFSLTWFAWTNGSLYLELHGRSDGRTRTFVFIQIGILAILAVYAADASGDSGFGFAIAYTAFLAVMTWLWYDVRRQDAVDRPEFLLDTGRHVIAMSASVLLILISAFLPTPLRLAVWSVFTLGWITLFSLLGRSPVGLGRGMAPTDSLVERFGTFTIIVLGEVVFSVVEGIAQSPHDVTSVATGLLALVVGFGFWWIYFDVIGGRLPKGDGGALANWILSHYPITLAIAAAGAGMVSLVEHAQDAATPSPVSWLLAGAVGVGMLALIPASRALADAGRLAVVYRPLWVTMVAGAIVSVIIGVARPAPWLLALLLVLVLTLVWAVAVRGFLRAGAWAVEETP